MASAGFAVGPSQHTAVITAYANAGCGRLRIDPRTDTRDVYLSDTAGALSAFDALDAAAATRGETPTAAAYTALAQAHARAVRENNSHT